MAMDPLTALAAAQKTDEALGLIAKLMGKLRAQPDVAALKLASALDEISKTYGVVDRAFNDYASLAIDEGALAEKSHELLAIAGGSLCVQVEQGRGDCWKIENIYRDHLKRWFERALNRQDATDLENAFMGPKGLTQADGYLFYQLTTLADQLQVEAKGVLVLVMSGRSEDARAEVMRTYLELAPVQLAIAGSMQSMFALKTQLVRMMGTT